MWIASKLWAHQFMVKLRLYNKAQSDATQVDFIERISVGC